MLGPRMDVNAPIGGYLRREHACLALTWPLGHPSGEPFSMEVLPWPQRGWQGEREQLWVKLEHYLKLHLTANVLMPAPLGEKRPAYTHAAGTWTWARYDWVCRDQKAIAKHDLGLLVRDVIVVDIDTVKDADALESRFPELCTAPAETTARGRHYFFQRSAKADSDGYYDGPAQRIPAVDLKTRAWGGGSGFVIVAPSTNKVCILHRRM